MRRYSRSWIRFLNDVPSITAGRCTGPVRSIILVFVCRRRLWMWVRKDLMGWLLIEGRHLLKVTWSDPRHVDAFPSFETLDSQNQWNRFLRAPVELRIITDNPITDPIHPEKMSREPLAGGIPPFSGPLSEPLSSLSPLSAIRSRRKKYPSLRYLFQILPVAPVLARAHRPSEHFVKPASSRRWPGQGGVAVLSGLPGLHARPARLASVLYLS